MLGHNIWIVCPAVKNRVPAETFRLQGRSPKSLPNTGLPVLSGEAGSMTH